MPTLMDPIKLKALTPPEDADTPEKVAYWLRNQIATLPSNQCLVAEVPRAYSAPDQADGKVAVEPIGFHYQTFAQGYFTTPLKFIHDYINERDFGDGKTLTGMRTLQLTQADIDQKYALEQGGGVFSATHKTNDSRYALYTIWRVFELRQTEISRYAINESTQLPKQERGQHLKIRNNLGSNMMKDELLLILCWLLNPLLYQETDLNIQQPNTSEKSVLIQSMPLDLQDDLVTRIKALLKIDYVKAIHPRHPTTLPGPSPSLAEAFDQLDHTIPGDDDREIITDATSALLHSTDEQIQAVIASAEFNALIDLLKDPKKPHPLILLKQNENSLLFWARTGYIAEQWLALKNPALYQTLASEVTHAMPFSAKHLIRGVDARIATLPFTFSAAFFVSHRLLKTVHVLPFFALLFSKVLNNIWRKWMGPALLANGEHGFGDINPLAEMNPAQTSKCPAWLTVPSERYQQIAHGLGPFIYATAVAELLIAFGVKTDSPLFYMILLDQFTCMALISGDALNEWFKANPRSAMESIEDLNDTRSPPTLTDDARVGFRALFQILNALGLPELTTQIRAPMTWYLYAELLSNACPLIGINMNTVMLWCLLLPLSQSIAPFTLFFEAQRFKQFNALLNAHEKERFQRSPKTQLDTWIAWTQLFPNAFWKKSLGHPILHYVINSLWLTQIKFALLGKEKPALPLKAYFKCSKAFARRHPDIAHFPIKFDTIVFDTLATVMLGVLIGIVIGDRQHQQFEKADMSLRGLREALIIIMATALGLAALFESAYAKAESVKQGLSAYPSPCCDAPQALQQAAYRKQLIDYRATVQQDRSQLRDGPLHETTEEDHAGNEEEKKDDGSFSVLEIENIGRDGTATAATQSTNEYAQWLETAGLWFASGLPDFALLIFFMGGVFPAVANTQAGVAVGSIATCGALGFFNAAVYHAYQDTKAALAYRDGYAPM